MDIILQVYFEIKITLSRADGAREKSGYFCRHELKSRLKIIIFNIFIVKMTIFYSFFATAARAPPLGHPFARESPLGLTGGGCQRLMVAVIKC